MSNVQKKRKIPLAFHDAFEWGMFVVAVRGGKDRGEGVKRLNGEKTVVEVR